MQLTWFCIFWMCKIVLNLVLRLFFCSCIFTLWSTMVPLFFFLLSFVIHFLWYFSRVLSLVSLLSLKWNPQYCTFSYFKGPMWRYHWKFIEISWEQIKQFAYFFQQMPNFHVNLFEGIKWSTFLVVEFPFMELLK